MAVFHITTTTPAAIPGRIMVYTFDAPYESVDQFTAAAQTSFLISGDKITWADDGRGGRLITKRERIGLGVPAIASVQVDRFRYWEPAE